MVILENFHILYPGLESKISSFPFLYIYRCIGQVFTTRWRETSVIRVRRTLKEAHRRRQGPSYGANR